MVVIFIVLSFSSLPVNTYGLDYSPISKQISPMIYTSGFHYLGFMHKFIEYPSSVQTMDFARTGGAERGPIEARSIDGLMVTFSAQFQYTLDGNSLLELYLRYGEDHKAPCIRFSVDSLNDMASHYRASMFFRNLTMVQLDMQQELLGIISKECLSTVTSLQIQSAELPSKYEDALTATNVAIQQNITVKSTQ